jgi:hypothetical protein
VLAAPAAVTSAHMPALAGLTQPGIAWGNGANGAGAGPKVKISCGSCHNPHGNGQYRILNTLPAATPDSTTGTQFSNAWVIQVVDYGIVVSPTTYRSASSMGVLNGDKITVTGNSNTAANATGTITMVDGPDTGTTPDDNLFTLSGVTSTTSGLGGTATRVGGTKVTDAAAPPAGDARNYTVIQTASSSPTLLASQAAAFSSTAGDYFHYKVPWNGLSTTASPTNMDAPNGVPGDSTTPFVGGFGEQMAAWCASCHTRYWAWSEPTVDTADGAATGPAYSNPRPGDDIYKYQHRTRGASGRGCLTCHVSHGTNAVMTEANSSTYTFPDGTVSDNSRLLKVDNRGTCQQCHDPTGTSQIGDQYPAGPVPSVP